VIKGNLVSKGLKRL